MESPQLVTAAMAVEEFAADDPAKFEEEFVPIVEEVAPCELRAEETEDEDPKRAPVLL